MALRPSRWPAQDGTEAYELSSEADRFGAARIAARVANQAGLSQRNAREFAIAVAELASNAVRHAGGGRVAFRLVAEPPGVSATITDQGPGFDEQSAFSDGFSRGRWRAPGEGGPAASLGAGLGAVRRLSDEVRVQTKPQGGTEITIFKYRVRPPLP